jgi:hypothetical protein
MGSMFFQGHIEGIQNLLCDMPVRQRERPGDFLSLPDGFEKLWGISCFSVLSMAYNPIMHEEGIL